MSRTRDEVDDLLQKSRISRDMQQEPDYNPQRNYRPNSGEVFLSEPGQQTSSYDASDVGGSNLKSTKDTMLYPNSPSTNLPGAFPVNALDDNKRSNKSSLSRHEQFDDYSGTTKNTAYSTDYAAGQIDDDPILRKKEDIAHLTSPSSEDAGNFNSTSIGQTQPTSQNTDGSTLNMGSNATGLNRDYAAGQVDEDPILGNKATATGISGPASAKTFGSTDITSDPNSTGNNAGMAKKNTTAAAATAAVGGFGAKIGSMLSRRKSKEPDLQQNDNSMNTNQDWNQGADYRKSMDAQRPDVSMGSTDFGNDQSESWNKQGQRYSLPATSSSYDKDLSGNLKTESQQPDLSSGNTFGSETSGAFDSQGKPRDISKNDTSFGTDQSSSFKTKEELAALSAAGVSLGAAKSGHLKSGGERGDLSGMKDSLDTDQSGSWKPSGQRGDLSGADASLGTDQSGGLKNQMKTGDLSGTDTSLGTSQSGHLKTPSTRGDISGTTGSLGSDQTGSLKTKGELAALSAAGVSLGAAESGHLKSEGERGDLSGTDMSLGKGQSGNLDTQGQRGGLSGTKDSLGTDLSGKSKTGGDGTNAYDSGSYSTPKLDTHRNLATGDNNNYDVSSNAATYGSTDVPYDSGNLDKDSQQEEPSKHTGAKAAAAGATAGGIGAMLSSAFGRKKSSGDINDKTVGNQGDMSSSGNVAGGDMASGNVPKSNLDTGNMTSGNVPSADVSSGTMPSGTMPSGNMPSGTMSSGNATGGGVNAPNDSIYGPSRSSTAGDNKPANITTKDISSPVGPGSNINNSPGSGGLNSGGLNSGGISSSNKGVPGSTTVDMNSPSQGNQDLSTLGIQANQPDSVKGNLDNSRGINTQNDRTNTSNDRDLLQPPSAHSTHYNNEPMSNGETVVNDKSHRLSGFASYIFGNELKLQGSYKIFLSKFLHNDGMKNDGLELKRKGQHILEMYRRAHQNGNVV
ncbi:unnamed protein product [Umbelopsis ramanniana]